MRKILLTFVIFILIFIAHNFELNNSKNNPSKYHTINNFVYLDDKKIIDKDLRVIFGDENIEEIVLATSFESNQKIFLFFDYNHHFTWLHESFIIYEPISQKFEVKKLSISDEEKDLFTKMITKVSFSPDGTKLAYLKFTNKEPQQESIWVYDFLNQTNKLILVVDSGQTLYLPEICYFPQINPNAVIWTDDSNDLIINTNAKDLSECES